MHRFAQATGSAMCATASPAATKKMYVDAKMDAFLLEQRARGKGSLVWHYWLKLVCLPRLAKHSKHGRLSNRALDVEKLYRVA